MTYFYDYFAKEYRVQHRNRLITSFSSVNGGVGHDRVAICKKVLKNAYAGYREGRDTEALKRLLGEYREYISQCGDELAKSRYNAFVYRYMFDVPVGLKAIGEKLNVSKDTVGIYINRVTDELLMLCMGLPAAVDTPKDNVALVRTLIDKNRILRSMSGEYVLSLFHGQRERMDVERGRRLTTEVLEWLDDTAKAYTDYCNDEDTRIETDINMSDVLNRCLSSGADCSRIAEEIGYSYYSVCNYMRENERRLSAMMFENCGK